MVHLENPGELSRYSNRLQAGWPGFDSQEDQNFSLLHCIQTGSEVHPTSYLMGTLATAKVKNHGAISYSPLRPHSTVLN
jgi:hypothetical protein